MFSSYYFIKEYIIILFLSLTKCYILLLISLLSSVALTIRFWRLKNNCMCILSSNRIDHRTKLTHRSQITKADILTKNGTGFKRNPSAEIHQHLYRTTPHTQLKWSINPRAAHSGLYLYFPANFTASRYAHYNASIGCSF